MDVTGRADRLIILFSQTHNPAVQIHQLFLGIHRTFLIPEHKCIVAQRLYFQIVIKIHYLMYLRIRHTA